MQFFVNLLFLLSSLSGVKTLPDDDNVWKRNPQWSNSAHPTMEFRANTSELSCPQGKYLQFPYVLYATQHVMIDGVIKEKLGDPDFKDTNHVFSQIYISCDEVAKGSVVEWSIIAYSKYFARVPEVPFVTARSYFKVFNETFYIGGGIGLAILAVFFLIILVNKENYVYLSALSCSAVFLAAYMALNVSPAFKLHIPVLLNHKIADTFLFLGFYALLVSFYLEKVLTKKHIIIVALMSGAGVLIILLGRNGDEVQFGTSLPFIAVIISLCYLCARYYKNVRNYGDRDNIFRFSFSVVFSLLIIWEMNIFSGALNGISIFPVCIVCAYLILGISANERIRKTYKERDQLLNNLEAKVNERTVDLQKALSEKEMAQAELIQNAKLASLGTLSAGIAHEINNNINYVNACVVGLEKEFRKSESFSKEKIEKLLSTIKHGTTMTIDIVNSLRSYTGLNQSKMREVDFKEIVHSVKTIIKRKLENINFREEYIGDTTLTCNVVGLNQMMMNLITNAIDVVSESAGEISIIVARDGNFLNISITDNGVGIPSTLIDKIFDPFFTTKDVGSGTGLGLYIVKKEVDAHKGKISVSSTEGKGTVFNITLPCANEKRGVA